MTTNDQTTQFVCLGFMPVAQTTMAQPAMTQVHFRISIETSSTLNGTAVSDGKWVAKPVRPSKATASISKVDRAARAVGFDGIGCTRDI